jgi:hypothetical protein
MLFLNNFYSLRLSEFVDGFAMTDPRATGFRPLIYADNLRVAVDRLWSSTVREYGTQSPCCSLSPVSSGFEPTKRWASRSLKDATFVSAPPPFPPQHPKSSGYLQLIKCFRTSFHRFRCPGSIPGSTRFSEKQWVWNGVHSASWVQMRSYLKGKVAAPV